MIFLNSASSAAALVFYLPCACTHTDTEGKQRKPRVRNIFKNSEKNTIFNGHPVHSSSARKDSSLSANLVVGYQPFFNISYTSHVTLIKPYLVTAVCKGRFKIVNLKCNFPMNPMSVCWLACHNSLKGQEITHTCSYRGLVNSI